MLEHRLLASARQARRMVGDYRAAIAVLRAEGATIEPSDVAGLTWVNGRELTIGQVIHLANGTEAPDA